MALEIAKGKPHTETLIKPCILKMDDIILGKDAERKLAVVSLSNTTIQRKIKDLSNTVLLKLFAPAADF